MADANPAFGHPLYSFNIERPAELPSRCHLQSTVSSTTLNKVSLKPAAAQTALSYASQMPPPQIVKLSGIDGQSLFLVWEPEQQDFLSLRDRTQWTDWNQFKTELRAHWEDAIDEGGSHRDQRFWEYLQRYERNAPKYLTSPPTSAETRDRDKKISRDLWIAGGLLTFFVLIVGSLLWEQGLAPLLGRLGVIQYTSPSKERYERFLAGVQECRPQKTVSTGAKNDIPPFQVFICPGGQEKIWAHKVEVVKQSANGSWLLEP